MDTSQFHRLEQRVKTLETTVRVILSKLEQVDSDEMSVILSCLAHLEEDTQSTLHTTQSPKLPPMSLPLLTPTAASESVTQGTTPRSTSEKDT